MQHGEGSGGPGQRGGPLLGKHYSDPRQAVGRLRQQAPAGIWRYRGEAPFTSGKLQSPGVMRAMEVPPEREGAVGRRKPRGWRPASLRRQPPACPPPPEGRHGPPPSPLLSVSYRCRDRSQNRHLRDQLRAGVRRGDGKGPQPLPLLSFSRDSLRWHLSCPSLEQITRFNLLDNLRGPAERFGWSCI